MVAMSWAVWLACDDVNQGEGIVDVWREVLQVVFI